MASERAMQEAAMTEPMSAEDAYYRVIYKLPDGDVDTAGTAIIQQYGDQRVAAALSKIDDPALVEVVARAMWREALMDEANEVGRVKWKQLATAAITAIKEKINGPA